MSSIGLPNSPYSSKAADTVRRCEPYSHRNVPFRKRATGSRGEGDQYCNTNEAALLAEAQAGDQQAFIELCNRHSRCIWRNISRIVKNYEDTEDIVQETLMRAYKHLNRFRGSCSFKTWITQIAINTSLMLLRKRKNRPEGSGGFVGKEGETFDFPEVADKDPNPEQIYSRVQRSLILSDEVSRLPAGFRPLMDLYYGEESSLADAAQALGITVAAAKSRLIRGRAFLRRRLRNHPLMCI